MKGWEECCKGKVFGRSVDFYIPVYTLYVIVLMKNIIISNFRFVALEDCVSAASTVGPRSNQSTAGFWGSGVRVYPFDELHHECGRVWQTCASIRTAAFENWILTSSWYVYSAFPYWAINIIPPLILLSLRSTECPLSYLVDRKTGHYIDGHFLYHFTPEYLSNTTYFFQLLIIPMRPSAFPLLLTLCLPVVNAMLWGAK